MTRFFKHALPAAALAMAGLAATDADAMRMRNCTGDTIKVMYYNASDTIQAFAISGGNVKSGARKRFGGLNKRGRYTAKVFLAQTPFDQLVAYGNNMIDATYSVVDDRGSWSVVKGDRCG